MQVDRKQERPTVAGFLALLQQELCNCCCLQRPNHKTSTCKRMMVLRQARCRAAALLSRCTLFPLLLLLLLLYLSLCSPAPSAEASQLFECCFLAGQE
jgi:hypothetical protein